ncbi:MAG: FtsW/RodA/SpoVE family cell cycle protein [Bacteroidales bacterium]
MRITYSTARDRAQGAAGARTVQRRGIELVALCVTSIVALAALLVAYQARMVSAADVERDVREHRVVQLDRVGRPEDLLPGLAALTDPTERRVAAERLFAFLSTPSADGVRLSVESVNAFGRVRVSAADMARDRRLAFLKRRLKPTPAGAAAPEQAVALLTPSDVAAVRPSFIVRSPGDVRRTFATTVVVFFAAFWLAHLFSRLRGRRIDGVLVPTVQLLCAIGLAEMIGLRDPLRDALLFPRFAQGVAAGCVVMALVSIVDFQRSALRKLSYVPLAGAFLLSTLLIVFGNGPGSSDARVNLFGVQPVEAIRVLVLLFLAGYFANRWEFLRELKEERTRQHRWLRYFEIPRLEYMLPVVAGIGLVLGFFFLQKDLGPALILAFVFLALYGVARRRLTLVAVGLGLLAAGFALGYALDFPHTVVQRVAMWRSPWDNLVRGGDQVSHAVWALASGGWWGAGLGLGDPHVIPAGHTDLILAGIGEELGFVGLASIFALFAVVAWRSFRIALAAPGDYAFFLALGIAVSLVLEVLLIAGGILGLMPLTGVVTPFLSYGRSSMIANFAVVGALLALSERPTQAPRTEFRGPVYALGAVVAALAAIVIVRVALVQVARADDYVAAANLTVQADGLRRFEYNPRLLAVARQIVRGTIYDRNGVPLAVTRRDDLEKHRDELERLGVKVDDVCAASARCYPFGTLTFHLLGDWQSKVNWAARNTSFVERDDDRVLRGYDDRAQVVAVADPRTGATTHVIRRDYRELLPLLRHRYEPAHPAVRQLLDRPRDLRVAIDVRLQMKVGADLEKRIRAAGKKEGAAVVLSDDGDLLAAVSYPWPASLPRVGADGETELAADEPDPAWLDRARYGLYPPGSSFKLVTAAAALRADPALEHATFTCERLPDGRVGTRLRGWARPIRDDVQDRTPHGTIDMPRALVVSCNAYFAQLGMKVGAQQLLDTARLFDISLAQPDSLKQVRDFLPFTAYGQGQVLASPFKMARVAATIAAGGAMPAGRWVIDEHNTRTDAPRPILAPPLAALLSRTMRDVVLNGTGRAVRDVQPAIAGKTGTAEVQDAPSHSWFVGFAPFDAPAGKRIAFAVIIEHGGYGASIAAPAAGDIVADARQLGIIK